ncbi:hypothetical protein M5K25_024062 [Dendrobium thyrsiflorum]|uniref:VASP tetramerisation domain-containing protein n=1 Tax=Dendrobium thyrsiflorum TaxID=117978 RepID=A0ABD0U158_DENTH
MKKCSPYTYQFLLCLQNHLQRPVHNVIFRYSCIVHYQEIAENPGHHLTLASAITSKSVGFDTNVILSQSHHTYLTYAKTRLFGRASGMRIKLISERDFFGEMTTKKVDALGGEVEQIKSRMDESFSTMKNRMGSRLGGLEEMIKKLIEMQSQAPPTAPITNPHHDLTGGPVAESKGKEIGREEFDEESSFHQDPPPRAPIRGGIGVSEEGTTRRELYDWIYGVL